MRAGYIVAGGFLFLVGIIFFTIGSLTKYTVLGGIIALIGQISLLFALVISIVGLFSHSKPFLTARQDADETLRQLKVPFIVAVFIPVFVIVLAQMIRSEPAIGYFILILAISYYMFMPIIKLLTESCGFVYKEVQPKTTLGKIVVAVISIIFGLFIIYLMNAVSGFLFVPFFLNPLGYVLAFLIGNFACLIAGVIILVVKGRLKL